MQKIKFVDKKIPATARVAGYILNSKVSNSGIFDFIKGDDTIFEKDVLPVLAERGELMSYIHTGFWQCMDTKREKDILEQMWNRGTAPWKVWG